MPTSHGFVAMYSSLPNQPCLAADSKPLIWFCAVWGSWRAAPFSAAGRPQVAEGAGWGLPDSG